jgi:hypothetical protein
LAWARSFSTAGSPSIHHLALVGKDAVGDDVEQGGLPGPVAAQKAADLAIRDGG